MSDENRTQAEKASSHGHTLRKDVLDPANLARAWKQVKANGGVAGIDGMETGDFPAFMREHWDRLRVKIEEGTYAPSPVRRVEIPKDGASGATRLLGIPTVLDRTIQQAIAQVLMPLLDPTFSEHSHGFRPGRSAHGAIDEMVREGAALEKSYGTCHVVDCDLAAFFDTVDHQKLMTRLRQRIRDPELLELILKYLKAGAILPGGNFEESQRGMPQGGPLSPLLGNLLLDELDGELEKRGHRFVRYADDFVILCTSLRAGHRIMQSISTYLADRLRLVVNGAKSQVVELKRASFLGFEIVRRKIRWTKKSRRKFKDRVRQITNRTRGHSPKTVIAELQVYVRGALHYYARGIPFAEIQELDRWVRRRVRLYHWKQWKRPKTRWRKLQSLGIGDEVRIAAGSHASHWRMSRNSVVQRAMSNAWLAQQGVPSLENQWKSIRYPNGPRAQKARTKG